MTARTESMRTFAITGGPIDVRLDHATQRLCLVFESEDMQVKLFRTMCVDEAKAFLAHFQARLAEVG